MTCGTVGRYRAGGAGDSMKSQRTAAGGCAPATPAQMLCRTGGDAEADGRAGWQKAPIPNGTGARDLNGADNGAPVRLRRPGLRAPRALARSQANADAFAQLATPSGSSPGPRRQKAPVPRGAGARDFNGADNGARTRDPHLGKVVLYQLSHVRLRGSNIREPMAARKGKSRSSEPYGSTGWAGPDGPRLIDVLAALVITVPAPAARHPPPKAAPSRPRRRAHETGLEIPTVRQLRNAKVLRSRRLGVESKRIGKSRKPSTCRFTEGPTIPAVLIARNRRDLRTFCFFRAKPPGS